MVTPFTRPFRFGVLAQAGSSAEWYENVLAARDLGYEIVLVSDHLGSRLAPMPALMAAAAVADVRVGTLVLANDFRYPALVAQEAMTVHTLTDGRFELGMGTGWLAEDYDDLGIEMAPGGERVRRLELALDEITGAWDDWDRDPPPLLLAGSGPRMLALAARRSDIVSITATVGVATREGFGEAMVRAGDRVGDQIGWIREAAGARFDALELNVLVHEAAITDDAVAAVGELGGPPSQVLASPHVLIGTVEEAVDRLERRRAGFGISYVVLPVAVMHEMAPVVARLAGS